MKIAALALGALALVAPTAQATENLNGAGASFPAPIYQRCSRTMLIRLATKSTIKQLDLVLVSVSIRQALLTLVHLTRQFLIRNLLVSPVLWYKSL